MKNSPEKKRSVKEKDAATAKHEATQDETVFTPPAKPAVKAQKGPDNRDEEALQDGSEFELAKTEDVH